MDQENEIRIEEIGTVKLLRIKGDVTASSEPIFKESYDRLVQEDKEKIVLIFEENAYINSGGIAVLIQILAETKRNNQHIAITGLSNHFEKIFKMVGITRFAEIFKTLDEAIESLQ